MVLGDSFLAGYFMGGSTASSVDPLDPSSTPNHTSKQGSRPEMSTAVLSAVSTLDSRDLYNFMYHSRPEQDVATYNRSEGSGVTGNGTLKDTLEASLPSSPPGGEGSRLAQTYHQVYHSRTPQQRTPDPTSTRGRREESFPHGSSVLEIGSWDFPLDSSGREIYKKSDFITSRLLNGMDVDWSRLKNEPKPRRKRRRVETPPTKQDDSDTSRTDIQKGYIRDVSFDERFLQYDESPYGCLDQLVPRAGNVPVPNSITTIEETCLRSIPVAPLPNPEYSRVGARFQARVARRMDDYSDKRNATYLPR